MWGVGGKGGNMSANQAPSYDASVYPTLRSLAIETLIDQMENGETDTDRRVAAIAALRYLTIVEDPRRKPPSTPAPSAPKAPSLAPGNPPASPPSLPPPSSTSRSSAPAAMAHSPTLAPPPTPAVAQASAQPVAKADAQVAAPSAAHNSAQTPEPASTSPPHRPVHLAAQRDSIAKPPLSVAKPPFVSTVAAFFTNLKSPMHRAGASP